MSLLERIIDLAVWWGLVAACMTVLRYAATHPQKFDPAQPLEGQREVEYQTITTRETAK